jgi:hypothetical protein
MSYNDPVRDDILQECRRLEIKSADLLWLLRSFDLDINDTRNPKSTVPDRERLRRRLLLRNVAAAVSECLSALRTLRQLLIASMVCRDLRWCYINLRGIELNLVRRERIYAGPTLLGTVVDTSHNSGKQAYNWEPRSERVQDCIGWRTIARVRNTMALIKMRSAT